MNDFRIIVHGGMCCGIKHIYGFSYHRPGHTCPEKRKTVPLKNEGSCYMNSPRHFHHPAAPAETYEQRLDRYLAYLDDNRPYGICEVVLSDTQLYYWQQPLLDRGFVKVNKCHNSNSHQTIHVFHRNKDK